MLAIFANMMDLMESGAMVGGAHSLRLLLIEDDSNDALLIVRELHRHGYEVIWGRVQSAPELQAALQHRWDVVTCDWVMPAFSATAALTILAEHGTAAPIIIVSGQAAEEVTVNAIKAGAHDVFSKDDLARLGPAIERELQDVEVRTQRFRADQTHRRGPRMTPRRTGCSRHATAAVRGAVPAQQSGGRS